MSIFSIKLTDTPDLDSKSSSIIVVLAFCKNDKFSKSSFQDVVGCFFIWQDMWLQIIVKITEINRNVRILAIASTRDCYCCSTYSYLYNCQIGKRRQHQFYDGFLWREKGIFWFFQGNWKTFALLYTIFYDYITNI